jgi:hypothetical protein
MLASQLASCVSLTFEIQNCFLCSLRNMIIHIRWLVFLVYKGMSIIVNQSCLDLIFVIMCYHLLIKFSILNFMTVKHEIEAPFSYRSLAKLLW